MKTLKSLFYSTFYLFIPVDKRQYAEHILGGGIILGFILVPIFVFLVFILSNLLDFIKDEGL